MQLAQNIRDLLEGAFEVSVFGIHSVSSGAILEMNR